MGTNACTHTRTHARTHGPIFPQYSGISSHSKGARIAHTTYGSHVMKRSLKYSDAKWKQYIEFLKPYLCMEEWFHDSNNKLEVINSKPQIAKVL